MSRRRRSSITDNLRAFRPDVASIEQLDLRQSGVEVCSDVFTGSMSADQLHSRLSEFTHRRSGLGQFFRGLIGEGITLIRSSELRI